MNKKAFIFDLDGVIVDTAKYHFLAWKKIAKALDINFTPEHNELLKGVSRVRSLDIILELGNIQAFQEDKDQWLIQKNEDYLSYLVDMNESEILPGVFKILQLLKEKIRELHWVLPAKMQDQSLKKQEFFRISMLLSTETMLPMQNQIRKFSLKLTNY